MIKREIRSKKFLISEEKKRFFTATKIGLTKFCCFISNNRHKLYYVGCRARHAASYGVFCF